MDLNYTESMLFRSAKNGFIESIKHYLIQGVHIECRDISGQTPLIIAAANGALEAVVLLLNRGADINAVDNDGCNALFRSILHAHLNIVKYLISAGANIHSKTRYGETAFSYAYGKVEIYNQTPPQAWMDEEGAEMYYKYLDICDLLKNAGASLGGPRP